jgi:arylsulfatase A-like enzyme
MMIPRRSPVVARRVILVVADGLRPDIIPLLDLPTLGHLARQGAATLDGRTVSPSVTAAAMASLLTGVEPRVHGLDNSRFRIPRPSERIDPMPHVLRTAGVSTSAWRARLPWTYRGLGAALGARLGFDRVCFSGSGAGEILTAARAALSGPCEGLLMLHWPDADRAGHDYGWPSPAYLRAARGIDHWLGELDRIASASRDDDTLLIVLADHGGGGTRRRDHDSYHPLNRRIPIILAGGVVRQTMLLPDSSLIDVPPTILHALGVEIPASYSGRVLIEAFRSPRLADRSRGWPEGFVMPLAVAS